MFVFKVYARVDDKGRVLEVGSSAFIRDLDGWVEIDRGQGDRYQHAQANYIPNLHDARGIPRYKIVDGKVIERTKDEIDSDVQPIADARLLERLKALESVVDSIKRVIDRLSPL